LPLGKIYYCIFLLENLNILKSWEQIKGAKNPVKKTSAKIFLTLVINNKELISEKLEIYQQICLVNLIQNIWWRKTKNIGSVKKLENLKYLLRKNIQPRLAWEIAFLKISIEDI